MGSPSELRIMCEKQSAWADSCASETETQTHGFGRAVQIERLS